MGGAGGRMETNGGRVVWGGERRSDGSTYFPGSGIWLQTVRRAWKLLRMAWMLAMPMNITSQLG